MSDDEKPEDEGRPGGTMTDHCPKCGTPRNDPRWPFLIQHQDERTELDQAREIKQAEQDKASAVNRINLAGFLPPVERPPHPERLLLNCGRCHYGWIEEPGLARFASGTNRVP